MRALVAHNRAFVRRRISSILDDAHIVTREAETYSQALERLQGDALIELVFVDQQLPDGSPMQLLRQARKLEHLDDGGSTREQKFVLVIGGVQGNIEENEDVRVARAAGFADVIPASAGRQDLTELLARINASAPATPSPDSSPPAIQSEDASSTSTASAPSPMEAEMQQALREIRSLAGEAENLVAQLADACKHVQTLCER